MPPTDSPNGTTNHPISSPRHGDLTDTGEPASDGYVPVAIAPGSMTWARYVVDEHGNFVARCDRPAADAELAVIGLTGVPGAYLPAGYASAAAARRAAAQLLGYVYRLNSAEPLPTTIHVPLLAPTGRTATTTTWELDSGLVLRHRVPFDATLTAATPEWTLTDRLAVRWAQALLSLAAELDHAHAQATRAVIADRVGATASNHIRGWLAEVADELTAEQARFADRLGEVLTEADTADRDVTLLAGIDLDHDHDLPVVLAELPLSAQARSGQVGHREVAEVIERLADRYALPVYVWTADDWRVRDVLDDAPLTEQQWQRVARSAELAAFGQRVREQQGGLEPLVDLWVAMLQAGVACRDCGDRIDGEVADTLGRCDACRPADPAEAAEQPCPGSPPTLAAAVGHLMDWGRPEVCVVCAMPLPESYRAKRAEERREIWSTEPPY